MQPGPILVYRCPSCSNLITNCSLESGNTFGSRLFSDGKSISPMLPESPNLTKCKKGDTIFWLSKLEEIGCYSFEDNDHKNWGKADRAKILEIDDYYRAISTGIAVNQEEEFLIRQKILWAYNDKIRKGQIIFKDESDELRWKDNAIKLLSLLDQSDINQKILAAEINRNLGNFDICISIIQTVDIVELNWLKEKFVNECNLKNRWVIALN